MNDVKQIVRELHAELRQRGIELTANVRRKVDQLASDEAAVGRMRDLINSGAAVNVDQYMTLRVAALDSRTALLGRDQIGPTKIRVVLHNPDGTEAPWEALDELRSENRRLKDEVAELRARLEAVP